MVEGVLLLILLLAGHALCDYPLQGDYLAQAKNRNTEIGAQLWLHGLAAHSLIHGGMVGLLTGSAGLAVAETLLHAGIDHAKCQGRLSCDADQALHILCKLLWFGIAL